MLRRIMCVLAGDCKSTGLAARILSGASACILQGREGANTSRRTRLALAGPGSLRGGPHRQVDGNAMMAARPDGPRGLIRRQPQRREG